MIKFFAPYSTPMNIMVLRNPELSNVESAEVEVNHRRSMNGTHYTYVKTSGRYKLDYTFQNVDRGKMLEVYEFVRAYHGTEMKIVDWLDGVWRAILETDEVELETNKLSKPCLLGRQESGSFQLTFNATKIIEQTFAGCVRELNVISPVLVGEIVDSILEPAGPPPGPGA